MNPVVPDHHPEDLSCLDPLFSSAWRGLFVRSALGSLLTVAGMWAPPRLPVGFAHAWGLLRAPNRRHACDSVRLLSLGSVTSWGVPAKMPRGSVRVLFTRSAPCSGLPPGVRQFTGGWCSAVFRACSHRVSFEGHYGSSAPGQPMQWPATRGLTVAGVCFVFSRPP